MFQLNVTVSDDEGESLIQQDDDDKENDDHLKNHEYHDVSEESDEELLRL